MFQSLHYIVDHYFVGDNLPSCELYLEDKNIKRVLNEKIREARTASVDLDPRPGDTEYVVVTWVENVQK